MHRLVPPLVHEMGDLYQELGRAQAVHEADGGIALLGDRGHSLVGPQRGHVVEQAGAQLQRGVGDPIFIELKVTETDPGIRGDTASGGTKPAIVETGAVIKVPLYLEVGEVIKIDTRTREYVERVR